MLARDSRAERPGQTWGFFIPLKGAFEADGSGNAKSFIGYGGRLIQALMADEFMRAANTRKMVTGSFNIGRWQAANGRRQLT